MMKKRICFSVAVLLVLAVAGGLTGCRKQQPLRVGFVGGLTGRVSDLGVAGRNGALLAVEQRNAAGGVKGRPVELIVRDDEQNPDTARRVVGELLARKVEAIIGPMTSSIAVVTVPLVTAARTVMVSPTVTTNDLKERDDYFIRVISNTSDYAAKSARYQVRRLGHRRLVAISDLNNRSYSESWLDDFRKTLEEEGGRLVEVKHFQSGDNAVFYGAVKELLTARPDAVLIVANAVDAALIAQQVRKLDAGMPIVMSEWASTERFIELGGAAVEGVHVAQFLDRNDTSPRYREFLAAYRKRFGQEPGFAGVAGYDAATLTLDALGRRADGQPLKELIVGNQFAGIQQPIKVNRFGDASRETFITIIRNGRFETVE